MKTMPVNRLREIIAVLSDLEDEMLKCSNTAMAADDLGYAQDDLHDAIQDLLPESEL